MKNTLSLTLIVRNEAHHLQQVLKYAHLFADEIVIVDTGSTDTTKEVARVYTDKIYDYVWKDDFAAARNFGLSKCTKDFVMWLDADDFISKTSVVKLSKLLIGVIDWDVCYLPYHYTYGEEGYSRLFFYRERIFRNKIKLSFQYPIHECIVIPKTLKSIQNNDIVIYHRTIKRLEDNSERNIRILYSALKTKKYIKSSRLWWLLGREYAAKNKLDDAIDACLKSIDLLKSNHGRQISQQLLELAILNIRLHKYEVALDFASKSLGACNLWREPYYEIGRSLWHLEHYAEALQMFTICRSIQRPKTLASIDLGLYDGRLLYDWISLTYDRLDDFRNALRYGKKALRVNPQDMRISKNVKFWTAKIAEIDD